MPDILKSDEQVTQRFVDMLDGTWAKKVSTAVVSSTGLEAGVSSYGYLRTTDEPTSLMNESFDSLDTTTRWTQRNVTGTSTVTNSQLTITSSTTASAYGGLTSKPTFITQGVNFLIFGAAVRIPTFTQANAVRFWGFGTLPGTPTTTTPVTDGYGFEVDGSGNLNAVVYRAGTKTFTSPIPATLKPADGAWSRYLIVQRADLIAFYVATTSGPAAIASFPSLNTSTLPASFVSVAGATPPAASANIEITAFGVADTGKNGQTIVDYTNPWVRSTVKDTTVEASSAETAIVVRERLPVDPFQYTGILTTNTAAAVNAAGAAGIRNYCSSLSFQNTSATATTILLLDGVTTIAQWNAPASMAMPYYHTFDPPIRTTAATALNINCGTTGANVLVNASGFRAA
jgi:hypothetical protein